MINHKKRTIYNAEVKIIEVVSKLRNKGETIPEKVNEIPNLLFTNYDQQIN